MRLVGCWPSADRQSERLALGGGTRGGLLELGGQTRLLVRLDGTRGRVLDGHGEMARKKPKTTSAGLASRALKAAGVTA